MVLASHQEKAFRPVTLETFWSRRALALGCALCFSCAPSERDAPTITEVNPEALLVGTEQALLISGQNFYGLAELNLNNPSGVKIHKTFGVLIDDTVIPSERINLLSTTAIKLLTPPNLPLGPHNVTVITPEGLSVSKPRAFAVVDDPTGQPGAIGGAFNNGTGGGSIQGNGGSSIGTGSGGTAAGGTGGFPSTGGGSSMGAGGSAGPSGVSPAGGSGGGGSGGSGSMAPSGIGYECLKRLPSGACYYGYYFRDGKLLAYNYLFFAQVADCVFTTSPDPDACRQLTGAKEFQVGINRPEPGTDARAYISADINFTLPSGAVLDEVMLILRVSDSSTAGSNATGNIWLSEAFSRDELFGKVPLLLGTAPIGADLGRASAGGQLIFSLDKSKFTLPGTASIAVVPASTDAVHYVNTESDDVLARPYFEIYYYCPGNGFCD